MVKEAIENFIHHNNRMENKGLLWDCLKCEIRDLTISYSSAIARARRQAEQELIDKITVVTLWMVCVSCMFV